ncbi:hypothetical protein [Pseudooceanicola aestuarii]|uniref:hypothetical protein n=1 Tax=Pseudooceanicola aestuarii TaxID=2697319 RepID=UPI0013D0533D|nr:hypothetical protein [Pseudooceanicola aestuarii]
MSAPDTNVDRQARRHGGPVWGILLSVAVGLLIGVAITFTALSGDEESPVDAPTAAEAEQ